MYGVEGRSWIALGDPVGPEDEKQELIWKFRELCDLHAAWTVFYEVQRASVHYYLDLGLTLFKIGEEARVRLDDFSLEGSARKWMRKMQRKVESEGASFAIVEADTCLAELRAVSDAWLGDNRNGLAASSPLCRELFGATGALGLLLGLLVRRFGPPSGRKL